MELGKFTMDVVALGMIAGTVGVLIIWILCKIAEGAWELIKGF